MPGPYPLPVLSVTIDAAGISAPPFEDILQSLQQGYRNIYGADLYLEPDSQDGQWLAVQALAIHNTNQALIAAYLSYSPTWGQGTGLSSMVKINGLRRLVPSISSAEVTLIGQAYTEINNGAVTDESGNTWDLPPQVVIPASGEVTVTVIARQVGAVHAEAGTINRIATPVPGWQSVSNLVQAVPGFPLESDATLRRRQAISTSLPAITPLMSVWAAIANLPGVGRIKVYQNDTHFYDGDGLPPHSLAAVVAGGDTDQIARTIAHKKNTGCGTFGSTQVIVYEPPAAPLTIDFFRLREVEIYVRVAIRPLWNYLNSTGQLILLAVEEYINTRDIGEDLHAAWICTPASLTGEAAVAATGRSQAELDRLRVTYVLDQILLGSSVAATPRWDSGREWDTGMLWDTLGEPGYADQHEIYIPFNAAAVTRLENITVTLV